MRSTYETMGADDGTRHFQGDEGFDDTHTAADAEGETIKSNTKL